MSSHEYKPTKSELAAIRKGEAEIARGEFVTLEELLKGHGLNRAKKRVAKVPASAAEGPRRTSVAKATSSRTHD